MKKLALIGLSFACAVSTALANPGQQSYQEQRQAQARAQQEALQRQLQAQREAYARHQSAQRQAEIIKHQQESSQRIAEMQRSNPDPTKSWQYKTVEKVLPVLKFSRDCAGGALVSGAMSGGNPLIMGAGCVGVSRGAPIIRGLKPNQAY